MSPLTVYGIKTCTTCREALAWLKGQGRACHWQDLRADGVSAARLQNWIDALGVEGLVNRRSTTWRELDAAARSAAMDRRTAGAMLAQHPTLIKRPIFETDGQVLVGFNAAVRDSL